MQRPLPGWDSSKQGSEVANHQPVMPLDSSGQANENRGLLKRRMV